MRAALEEALGLRFEGDKGEHFFRSTLVQTLFYGVFSAWVLWAKRRRAPPAGGDRSRPFPPSELREAAGALRRRPTASTGARPPGSCACR